jgi:glutamate racemase
MNKKTILFTDSGLGGLTIMADFVEQIKKENLSFDIDIVFFNAQKSHSEGYKALSHSRQIYVFQSALKSMLAKYNPDVIVIACNTLSVIYFETEIYKNIKIPVLDIIKIGKRLLQYDFKEPVIEIAMPTTIESAVYSKGKKNIIPIPANIMLPHLIENHPNSEETERVLKDVFESTELKFKKSGINCKNINLFLGCTHFPLIKHKFIKSAEKQGFNVKKVLNPNSVLSAEAKKQIVKFNTNYKQNKYKINIKVVSKMEFRANEVKNISKLIEVSSAETAAALKKYELIPELW